MIRLPSPNIILQPKNIPNHPVFNTPKPANNFNHIRPSNSQDFKLRNERSMPQFKKPTYNHYAYNNRAYKQHDARQQLEHWCETCDRGFKSNQLLEEHKSEHQVCGIDGCKFFAHPKIVTNHIQMQHSTGLYNRIRNLETPEDIANWVKERKRNYPSKDNVEKKKAQVDECINRGEKIQDKKPRFNNRDRKNNESKFSRRNDRRSRFNQRRRDRFNNKEKGHIQESSKDNQSTNIISTSVEEEEESYCGLKPFKGILELVRNDNMNEEILNVADTFNIEDEEWNDNKSSKYTCKALSSLVAAYGSYDEESESEAQITCSSNNTSSRITNPDLIHITNNDSDGSAPEEAIVKRTDDIEKSIASSVNLSNKLDRKRKRDIDDKTELHKKNKIAKHPPNTFDQQIKYYKERPSTLLEKLLEKDIRHERNVILQCINYIVKNNFFDK